MVHAHTLASESLALIMSQKLIEIAVDLLIMKWIIFASVLIAVSLAPVYAQPPLPPPVTGTCASIGYDTSCCPRGADCRATDGKCNCGDDCYLSNYNDCCSDVGCPRCKYISSIIACNESLKILGTLYNC